MATKLTPLARACEQLLPESARWLALRGREEDAVEAQVQLEGSRGSRESAERQVSEMLAMAAKQRSSEDPADAGVFDVRSVAGVARGLPPSPSVRQGVDAHLSDDHPSA